MSNLSFKSFVLVVLTSVFCCIDAQAGRSTEFDVGGDVVVYNFDSKDDSTAFTVNPNKKSDFNISGGCLNFINTNTEHKVLFPSITPLREFCVSIRFKLNAGNSNASGFGFYAFASEPSDYRDFINALHISNGPITGTTFTPSVVKFTRSSGWGGPVATGKPYATKFDDGWMTITMIAKGGKLYQFYNDETEPHLVYTIPEGMKGDIGFRSDCASISVDYVSIQSPQYKKPTGTQADYEVGGDVITYDFTDDEDIPFLVYPATSSNVYVADGMLNTINKGIEQKVIFPSITPLTEFKVRMKFKLNEGNTNASGMGFYAFVSEPTPHRDFINALHISNGPITGTIFTPSVVKFTRSSGWGGPVATGKPYATKFNDGWMTITMIAKGGKLYQFYNDETEPYLIYDNPEGMKGDIGFRSDCASISIDYVSIQSPEYKRVIDKTLDFEFNKTSSVEAMSIERGVLSQANGCLVATINADNMIIGTPEINVAKGNRYSMKLPLRNTFLIRMANNSNANKVTVKFRTSESGNAWYEEQFPIKPNSDFNTYYFNVSRTNAEGYLRELKLVFNGASEGAVKIDAITFEREEKYYNYAGFIESCKADTINGTVTVSGKVKDAFNGKTVNVLLTDLRNYTESVEKCQKKLSSVHASDNRFTATFPLYENGTGGRTYLSNQFIAEIDGIKVAPAFAIENYRDFSTDHSEIVIKKKLVVDVTDYGAKGDGFSDDTEAIQKAIDAVAAAGGGQVTVPGDSSEYGRRYVITHIELCSNLDLVIEKGAVLWQSQREKELNKTVPVHMRGFNTVTYGHNVDIDGLVWCHAFATVNKPMIYAANCNHLRISGGGIIRMNDTGGETEDPFYFVGDPALAVGQESRVQQMPILIYHSKNIDLHDLTLLRSNGWQLVIHQCDSVYLGNITEKQEVNVTSDGFQFAAGTQNVILDRCMNYTSDDAVTFTTGYIDKRNSFFNPNHPDEDQAVRNIKIRHSFLFGGFGIVFILWGTEAPNGEKSEIRNIEVYDCSLGGHKSSGTWPDDPFYGWSKTYSYTQSEDNNYVPITGVRFHDNNYLAPFDWSINNIRPWATNMIVSDNIDGTIYSTSTFMNGNFDKKAHNGEGFNNESGYVTGLAWWTVEEDKGGHVSAVQTGTKEAKFVDTGETFTQADYAGCINGNGSLYQGLYLQQGDYKFIIKAKHLAGDAKIFVKSLQDNQIIAEQSISANTNFMQIELNFNLSEAGTYGLGVVHKGSKGELLYIDDAEIEEIYDPAKYTVDGTPVVYSFNKFENEYKIYSNNQQGVREKEGQLVCDASTEHKIIFESEAPLSEFMVSCDINTSGNAVNAGIYLFGNQVQNTPDKISAINVQLEGGRGTITPKIFLFDSILGYQGAVASSNSYVSSGTVNLKVVCKGGMLYVFLDNSTTPCISYHIGEGYHGDVGLRSQCTASTFDNMTIKSTTYKKKTATAIDSMFRNGNSTNVSKPFYTISGVQVYYPSSPGVYIKDKRKVVLH